MVKLSAITCSFIAISWVSLVSFAFITLCIASQRVIPKVSMYFFIDSVRKVLDTPSYYGQIYRFVFHCSVPANKMERLGKIVKSKSFQAFTAMLQVEFFWVVTPYNFVVGYRRFRSLCCLFTLKMEAPRSLKRWYPTTKLHGVTTLKTST
jgi:hypothetical protein